MPAGSTPSPTGAPRPGLPADRTRRTGLVPLAAVFLRIGLTAFGGPAGHIAIMRDEFVRRRGWLDDAAFVDLVGAANLIPGPTSTRAGDAHRPSPRRAEPVWSSPDSPSCFRLC